MRILITTDLYKPAVNGVVTSVENLAEGLIKDGHDVRILTLSNSHHSMKVGNIYYIGSVNAGIIYPNVRILMAAGKDIVDEIVDWKPDVIHTQCEFSTFIYAKIIAHRTNAPIVHTYHTVYESFTSYFCPSRRLGRELVKSFTRTITDHTEAVIVPTGKISDMLEGYEVHTPMYVIPSGIKLDRFINDNIGKRREIRERLGIGEDECVLTFVGRVAKEKNIEEILEFMQDERTRNIRFLIVGDGPDREEVESEAARLGVADRVIMTGMIRPEEVADYYKAGDIFVSASTSETQGLTYMEAMASGLTLLCRKDDALDGVVEFGRNGFTYESKEDFIITLNNLMNNARVRKTVGENARKSVYEKYSVETFVNDCEKIYSNLVA